ncbi:MAG: PIG-L family deacetylase [Myxococcales bacterium]|nr:PIG-L family deacetylase [Myxococcales bacterium]MCB9531557.1 PIG-L family deacetylase [Myxococcales bacterium]MCB9532792.1 PIG-L family deacetylase [Myxococcales bacterium]
MTTLDIDRELAGGARLLWCCAHPDDEFLTGGLLARARLFHGVPTHLLVMTRGGGGNNALGVPDLPAARAEEMQAVADALGATLEIHDFWNATLPEWSFPPRREILRRWQEQANPTAVIRASIEAFRPDIVLTFDPEHGATGHPEHTLVSRLTVAALHEIAPAARPRLALYALRRHWAFRALKQADPGPVDGWFDGRLPCADGKSCQQKLVDLLHLHASQEKDMSAFRLAAPLFSRLGLRRIDVDRDAGRYRIDE